MSITFGDGAEEAFVNLADLIPIGYTVALLPEGAEVSHNELDPAMDVSIVGADQFGVHYRQINSLGEIIDRRTIHVRPWDEIDRIHVY